MDRQLVVVEGKEKGKVYPLPSSGSFTIGRGNTTDTKLTDLRVSRTHCTVECAGTQVRVVDAKSATGTFVNNNRIPGEYVLHTGDVIKIGDTEIRYEGDEDVAEAVTVAGFIPAHEAPTIGAEGLAAASARQAVMSARDPYTELVGTTLGHFTITKFVAAGRSTIIYRAQDNQEDRVAALKVLKPEGTKNAGEMQSLTRTLQPVLTLRHPNLVALYDLGRDRDRCWFACEFVQGQSLGSVMERGGVANMVDWQHALRWGIHVTRGLAHLHEHQVIHGNITPHAVLVNASDKVAKLGALADARPVEQARAKPKSRSFEALTHVAYRAPEQVRGDIYGDVASDLYCLGATLYALLTGRPPYEGATPVETLAKVLQADVAPPPPREYQLILPEAFERIVLRLLAKRPDERYLAATDLLADLESAVSSQGPASATHTPQAGSTAREGTIPITCGNCGQKLRPWRKFVGSQVRCPSCTKLLRVPEEPGVVQPFEAATLTGPRSNAAMAQTEVAPKPYSNTVVMAVTGIIMAAGLGLAAYLALANPGTPKSPETQTTQPGK